MALDHQGGNSHVRWLLIEAAWHERQRPRVSEKLAAPQRVQRPLVLERAWRAWRVCTAAGSGRPITANRTSDGVATARELAGYV